MRGTPFRGCAVSQPSDWMGPDRRPKMSGMKRPTQNELTCHYMVPDPSLIQWHQHSGGGPFTTTRIPEVLVGQIDVSIARSVVTLEAEVPMLA